MKKSTLILLLLFLVSGTATVWYLKNNEEKNTTLMDSEADFTIKDTDEIGKIFLASRVRGTQFLLERKGEFWYVNDSLRVYPQAIESLLAAMRSMRIKYRPGNAAIPNIAKELAADQVKTEIYDREGNLMKSYYVGGETKDARGTYIIMEGSEKPFVMEIPYISGSFKVRYDLSLLDIMDKAYIREKPEDINFVSVEYPTRRDQSFKLDLTSGKPVVTPFYPTTKPINKTVSSAAVESYLLAFEKSSAESLVGNDMGRARFAEAIPFADIVIGYKDGTRKQVTYFPKETYDPMTGDKVTKIEKLVVAVDGQYDPMYLVQYYFTKQLFLGYPAFFE